MSDLIDTLKTQFGNKNILVVGLGLQGGGAGVARFFARLGAYVTVTDLKTQDQLQPSLEKLKDLPITYTLGEHKREDFLEADIIFKGPSVSWDLSQLKEAQMRKIPVEMESSFFAERCPAPIIGITGTRGKSTTTYMIFRMLEDQGLSCHLAGNIPGISTINVLEKIKPTDWVVMELSSWQLSGFHRKKISPHIAVFTSFSPDHLNLYASMKNYLHDKKAIYLYQNDQDYLIINEELKAEVETNQVKSQVHYVSARDFPSRLMFLKGEHNQRNASCAYEVAKILKLDLQKAAGVIAGFKGLPYRQEIVATKDGIIFINDTTSTTPTASVAAIRSFSPTPIVLILGGNSKNLSYKELLGELSKPKKIVLLTGTFTDEILPYLKERYQNKITKVYNDLNAAVKDAYEFAKNLKGQGRLDKVLILLSPAATSFSMFQNEFHRGEEFNKIVKKII